MRELNLSSKRISQLEILLRKLRQQTDGSIRYTKLIDLVKTRLSKVWSVRRYDYHWMYAAE